MSFQIFLILFMDGLLLSGVYALAALGFVIIYRATGVFNFAQGEFMMVGAYVFYLFFVQFDLPFAVAVVFAVGGLGLIGAGIYLLVLRQMTAQPLFAAIIVTMGVAILLRSATGIIWSANHFHIGRLLGGQYVSIGGVSFAVFDLLCLGLIAAVFIAVMGFLRFSPIGLEMRASAENPTLASQRGVNLNTVFAVSWAIAAATAAVAGGIAASRGSVTPELAHLGIAALPAALVGGLDSVGGVVVGGLIVGFAHTTAAWFWGPDTQDVISGLLLLAVLMIRPYGVFGSRHIARV